MPRKLVMRSLRLYEDQWERLDRLSGMVPTSAIVRKALDAVIEAAEKNRDKDKDGTPT